MYTSPRLEAELDYDGSELAHADDLHTSYGMDFVEVELERAVHSQPLSIKVQSQSASARFNVQIWQLGAGYARPRPTTPRCEIGSQNQDGAHVYVIPQVNTSKYNRLAIIITRLDPDETAEPNGNYMITLSSAG